MFAKRVQTQNYLLRFVPDMRLKKLQSQTNCCFDEKTFCLLLLLLPQLFFHCVIEATAAFFNCLGILSLRARQRHVVVVGL
jgi:hypothetical protein